MVIQEHQGNQETLGREDGPERMVKLAHLAEMESQGNQEEQGCLAK